MQENEGKKKQQMKIITFKATNLKKNKLKQKPTKKNKKKTHKKEKKKSQQHRAPHRVPHSKKQKIQMKKKNTQNRN